MRSNRTAPRWVTLAAVGAATTLALTACAGSSSGDEPELSDEPVTLSFTWWGNDVRHEITEELIAAFEEENPNITIEPQYTDWGGYWDKLQTSVAAGEIPDIIQMDEKQMSTYAVNGVLLDLGTLGDALDTSAFPGAILGTGALDGTQYAIPVGMNAYTYMTNLDLLDELGIEVPDDETWTWDDLFTLSAEITEATGGEVYGTETGGFTDAGMIIYLRQNGEELFATDGSGEVTASPETLAAYWQQQVDALEAGATPSAEATIERAAGGLSESFIATNEAVFGPWWTNQVSALREASGQNLVTLRPPSAFENDSAYYKPSMFWSVSSQTEHPAEAALFVDWLANSEAAADLLLAERGVPANQEMREYITPSLDEANQAAVEFLNDLEPIVGDAPPATPPGGGVLVEIVQRHTEQVMFGEMTPEEAADSFIDELQTALDDAAI